MRTSQEGPLEVGKMRKEYYWLQIAKIENNIKHKSYSMKERSRDS